MSEPKLIKNMSVDEYLEYEEQSQSRHEYVRGQLFAMAGATDAHNIIAGNLHAALHGYLAGSGCKVYIHDMKVRVEEADCFYYPDIMVTCEPFQSRSVFKAMPILIIEVLSKSTRQIDKREKLLAYRELPTLKYYVLVHQNRCRIEFYMRTGSDEWTLTTLQKSDALTLDILPKKPFEMAVSSGYAEVDVPSTVEEDEEEYEFA